MAFIAPLSCSLFILEIFSVRFSKEKERSERNSNPNKYNMEINSMTNKYINRGKKIGSQKRNH
jgi:hypothetical protein